MISNKIHLRISVSSKRRQFRYKVLHRLLEQAAENRVQSNTHADTESRNYQGFIRIRKGGTGMNPELERKMRTLRLSSMVATLDSRTRKLSVTICFHRFHGNWLVEDELNLRRDRLFARRLKQSHIPSVIFIIPTRVFSTLPKST